MPLLPRSTVVDRPTLVDRDDDEDNEAEESSQGVVEELGDADGPVINGIRFEQGDYAVVAAANLSSILSTAQTEGDQFKQSFMTSAIQIKEMADSGIDIAPLARMSRDRGLDDINISQEEMQQLKLATHQEQQEDDESGDEVQEVSEDDSESESDDSEEDSVEDDESDSEEAENSEDDSSE